MWFASRSLTAPPFSKAWYGQTILGLHFGGIWSDRNLSRWIESGSRGSALCGRWVPVSAAASRCLRIRRKCFQSAFGSLWRIVLFLLTQCVALHRGVQCPPPLHPAVPFTFSAHSLALLFSLSFSVIGKHLTIATCWRWLRLTLSMIVSLWISRKFLTNRLWHCIRALRRGNVFPAADQSAKVSAKRIDFWIFWRTYTCNCLLNLPTDCLKKVFSRRSLVAL